MDPLPGEARPVADVLQGFPGVTGRQDRLDELLLGLLHTHLRALDVTQIRLRHNSRFCSPDTSYGPCSDDRTC